MNVRSLLSNIFVPTVVCIVAAALIFVCVMFLPSVSAGKEYAKELKSAPATETIPGSNIKAKDIINMSLVELTCLYNALSKTASGDDALVGIIAIVMTVGVCAFTILTALFAFWERPIWTFIFNLLSFGFMYIFNLLFTSTPVDAETYYFGIGYYLSYIAAAVVAIGAIWMLIAKIISKRKTC